MALINGIYIHVTDEKLQLDNEVSSHPVEDGIDITDTIKPKPPVLSISGKIVDYGSVKSYTALAMIKKLKEQGSLVTYSGRNLLGNMQITSLTTSHPNTNSGGADFDMELQECRIVTTAYVDPEKNTVKDGGKQQVDKGENKAVYYTVKKGDCVWNLVVAAAAPFKTLLRPKIDGKSYSACNWVMKNNAKAFSRKGDFRTLQIGAKLLVGYRK